MKILVSGSLRTGSYENNDGNKVYTTDLFVEEIELLGKKETEKIEEKQEEIVESDPFADFGETVSIEDSFLD